MFRAGVLTLIVLAGSAVSGGAQTNDPLFRSWAFHLDPPSPRSAALGGAFDACADDAVAVQRNPAGISALHKAELLGAGGLRQARGGALGDTLGSRTGLAFAGGALHLTPRLAAGVYVAQPHALTLRLAPAMLPDGLHDEGTMDTVVTEVGTSIGWRLSETLHVGLRMSARHLSLQGRYAREPAQGVTNLRVGTSSSSTVPGGALGVLLQPLPALRIGLVAEIGRGWRVQRTATSPRLGVVLDPGSEYELRQPTRLSTGIALRTSPRLTLYAQVDRVRLHEVQSRLAIAQGAYARAEYTLDDAWEGGAGAEISIPFRSVGLQVRAGARTVAPKALRYTGRDAVAAAAFVGSGRQTLFGGGVGLFTRGGLHADVSLTSGDGTVALAGAGLRF